MKIKKNFMDIMKGRGKNKMWERPEKRVPSIKYQGQIEDDVIHSFTHDEFSISLRSIEINLRSISVFFPSWNQIRGIFLSLTSKKISNENFILQFPKIVSELGSFSTTDTARIMIAK